ncbi:MAG TPA: hypothetical protein VGL68_05305 [Solirubrobacteraceae bacterium]|jgi:hypothetical protein
MWLRQAREDDGDDAARLKAQNLIENQLLYPRALMPILLSKTLPFDGGVQQP